ncbi:uncharacterized protein [Diadema antillarum]|uniref:uncharacterized protein n=1 Tax=Diadema antillarum TaxID=105358 RepID=UPI003A897523
MCSSRVLHKVTIQDSQFHMDFYKILGEEAAICQIQDLTVSLNVENAGSFRSSVERHLAKWVCTMPKLSTFNLTCFHLRAGFLTTAAELASSCQIQNLTLSLNTEKIGSYQSSAGERLAKWLCTMPRLSTFSLKCFYVRDAFLTTVAKLASSCQIRDLTLSLNVEKIGSHRSSVGEDLATWLSSMPRLSTFNLKCFYLRDGFLAKAAELASSCQIRKLSMEISMDRISDLAAANLSEFLRLLPHLERANLKILCLPETFDATIAVWVPHCKLLESITVNGKQLLAQRQENERGRETGHGSGQDNLQAPEEPETSRDGNVLKAVVSREDREGQDDIHQEEEEKDKEENKVMTFEEN